MILKRGKVIAYGEKSDVCDRPTSIEAARLMGRKNFSRAEKIGDRTVRAIDWNCTLELDSLARNPYFTVGTIHELPLHFVLLRES